MLNDDGTIYTDNLRAAKQTDTYTMRGSGDRNLRAALHLSRFPLRRSDGLQGKPQLDALTGRVFNSAMTETGSFECSDPMLNKLWQNILWTQRGNMHEHPHRLPAARRAAGLDG